MFGDSMRKWREIRGLSQRALAELSGINYVTIARIEKGEQNPTEELMLKVANALKVPLGFMLSDKANEHIYAIDEIYKDDPELQKLLANPQNKEIVGLLKDITEVKIKKEDLESIINILKRK